MLAQLSQRRREPGVVYPHQRLTGLDQVPLSDKKLRDQPAFKGFQDLDLAGRNNRTLAACDFFKFSEIRPGYKSCQQRHHTKQQRPDTDGAPHVQRRPDIVCKGFVHLAH